MSDPRSLRGKSLDEVFKGQPKIPTPFPSAPRSKINKDYDEVAVGRALKSGVTSKVDPTTLHASQPWITQEGVRHYVEDRPGHFADGHLLSNTHPVVYHREVDGRVTSILLGGHHRATAAAMKGEDLEAYEARGGWGGSRR